MAASQQFFYDAQIERFIAQFIRMVSGFQVEFGKDREGNKTLQRVPVYYGDSSRQVMNIISNNSAGSALPTVPAMTVYINNVTYDRDRIQQPDHPDRGYRADRLWLSTQSPILAAGTPGGTQQA